MNRFPIASCASEPHRRRNTRLLISPCTKIHPNQHPKPQTVSPILLHIYLRSIRRTTVQIQPNASRRSARFKTVVQFRLHGCACRVRHRNTTISYPVCRRKSRSAISRYGFVFSFHRCSARLRSRFLNLHTTMASRISDSWQRLTERGSQKLKSVAAKQGWRTEMGDQEEDYSSLPLTDRFVHKVGFASTTFGSVKLIDLRGTGLESPQASIRRCSQGIREDP